MHYNSDIEFCIDAIKRQEIVEREQLWKAYFHNHEYVSVEDKAKFEIFIYNLKTNPHY